MAFAGFELTFPGLPNWVKKKRKMLAKEPDDSALISFLHGLGKRKHWYMKDPGGPMTSEKPWSLVARAII